jgi:hypothetical protein
MPSPSSRPTTAHRRRGADQLILDEDVVRVRVKERDLRAAFSDLEPMVPTGSAQTVAVGMTVATLIFATTSREAAAALTVGPPPAQPQLGPVQSAPAPSSGRSAAETLQPASAPAPAEAKLSPQPAATSPQPAAPTPEAAPPQSAGGQGTAEPTPDPTPAQPAQVAEPQPQPQIHVEPVGPPAAPPTNRSAATAMPASQLQGGPTDSEPAVVGSEGERSTTQPAPSPPLTVSGTPANEPTVIVPPAAAQESPPLSVERPQPTGQNGLTVQPPGPAKPLNVEPATAAAVPASRGASGLQVRPAAAPNTVAARLVPALQNTDGTVSELHPTITGASLDGTNGGVGQTEPANAHDEKITGWCLKGSVHAGPGGQVKICPTSPGPKAYVGGGVGGGVGPSVKIQYDSGPPSNSPYLEISGSAGVPFAGVGDSATISADGASLEGNGGPGPVRVGSKISTDDAPRPTFSYDPLYETKARQGKNIGTIKLGAGAYADVVIPLQAPDVKAPLSGFQRYLNKVQQALIDRNSPRSRP